MTSNIRPSYILSSLPKHWNIFFTFAHFLDLFSVYIYPFFRWTTEGGLFFFMFSFESFTKLKRLEKIRVFFHSFNFRRVGHKVWFKRNVQKASISWSLTGLWERRNRKIFCRQGTLICNTLVLHLIYNTCTSW